MTQHGANALWKNFHSYDLFSINPEEVQKQTCEKLKSDFGLSDDEAKNYYDMIKDEKNNKIIKEIEERVKIKIGSTDSFKIENKPLVLNLTTL